MTTKFEQLFLHWILKNPEQFKQIEPSYFESSEIQLVYETIRDEYLTSIDKIVPKNKEIIALVGLKDTAGEISIDTLKSILKLNISEYREESIIKKFNAWKTRQSMYAGVMECVEKIRNVKDITDLDSVTTAKNDIKSIIEKSTNIQIDKEDIGLDFDDVDAHDQHTEYNKVSTGYKCMDTMMGGGFDRKTLNVLVGASGSGKSIHLINFGVNAANSGHNVCYITLELSDKKAMKRIGAMRLSIPINKYDEYSKDKEYMREKIAQVNNFNNSEFDLDNSKPGKLFVKEFPSGTATVSDIENYVKLVEETKKVKIDMVIVDYIQIMGTEKGIDRNMLYLKGEHLAVGLRAIGQKFDLVMLTATQLDKSKYGAINFELEDIPESKAIAETADSVWGIILTPKMKKDGIYNLKRLKMRDSDSEYERIKMEMNKKTLKCGNDSFVSSDD